MAETKPTKSGKAKPEEHPAVPPSSAKRAPQVSSTKASPARSAVKSTVGSGKSATLQGKTEAKSASTPEAVVKRRVKDETAKEKPARKLRPSVSATKAADHAARLPGRGAELPDPQETYRMIAEAAYYLAEKRNFAPGWEQEDWESARKEVMAQLDKRAT